MRIAAMAVAAVHLSGCSLVVGNKLPPSYSVEQAAAEPLCSGRGPANADVTFGALSTVFGGGMLAATAISQSAKPTDDYKPIPKTAGYATGAVGLALAAVFAVSSGLGYYNGAVCNEAKAGWAVAHPELVPKPPPPPLPERRVPTTPVRIDLAGADPLRAFDESVRALAVMTFEIETAQREAGVIQTKPQNTGERRRFHLTVVIADGTITIRPEPETPSRRGWVTSETMNAVEANAVKVLADRLQVSLANAPAPIAAPPPPPPESTTTQP